MFKGNLHQFTGLIYISSLINLSFRNPCNDTRLDQLSNSWKLIINNIIILHLGYKKTIMHSNPILSQCPKMQYFGNQLNWFCEIQCSLDCFKIRQPLFLSWSHYYNKQQLFLKVNPKKPSHYNSLRRLLMWFQNTVLCHLCYMRDIFVLIISSKHESQLNCI